MKIRWNEIALICEAILLKDHRIHDFTEIFSILQNTDLKNVMPHLFPGFPQDSEPIFSVYKEMTYQFFQKGSIIYKEGDPETNKIYLILSGEFGTFKKTRQTANLRSTLKLNSANNQTFNPNFLKGLNKRPNQLNSQMIKNAVSDRINEKNTCLPVYMTDNQFPSIKSESFSIIKSNRLNFFSLIKSFFFVLKENVYQKIVFKIFEKYYLRDTLSLSSNQIIMLKKSFGREFVSFQSGCVAGVPNPKEDSPEQRDNTLIALKNTQVLVIDTTSYQRLLQSLSKIQSLNFHIHLQNALKCRLYDVDVHFLKSITNGIEVN